MILEFENKININKNMNSTLKFKIKKFETDEILKINSNDMFTAKLYELKTNKLLSTLNCSIKNIDKGLIDCIIPKELIKDVQIEYGEPVDGSYVKPSCKLVVFANTENYGSFATKDKLIKVYE